MAHLFSTAGRHKQSKLSSSWNPRFWSAYHDENFQTITGKLLDWMESLCAMNPKAFGALYGLTPMNEPAHMRGLYDPDAANAESTYDLGGSKACGSSVSAAAVLDTLAISIIEFRKQPKLIQANKNLVMNVIETSFSETFGGKVDKAIFGASQNGTEAQYVTIGNAMSWTVIDLAMVLISWLELSINMDSFGYAKGTKELKSLRIVRLVRSLRIVRLVMDAPASIPSVFFIRSEWLIIIFRMIQIILILWQRCSSLEPGSSSYLHSKPRV